MNIYVDNFRSVERLSLQFPAQISAFVGESGAGKTTTITAICWILYGSKGSGPHRAINVKGPDGNGAPTGILMLPSFRGRCVVAVRMSPRTGKLKLPAWVPHYAQVAITGYTANSVFEGLWVNGELKNFEAARTEIFGSHDLLTSTAVVSQKMASQLLVPARLSQVFTELVFDTSDHPDKYATRLKDLGKEYRAKLNAAEGALNAANYAVTAAERDPVLASYTVDDAIRALDEAKAVFVGTEETKKLAPAHPADFTAYDAFYNLMEQRVRERSNAIVAWKSAVQRYREAAASIPDISAAESTLVTTRDAAALVPADIETQHALFAEQQRLRLGAKSDLGDLGELNRRLEEGKKQNALVSGYMARIREFGVTDLDAAAHAAFFAEEAAARIAFVNEWGLGMGKLRDAANAVVADVEARIRTVRERNAAAERQYNAELMQIRAARDAAAKRDVLETELSSLEGLAASELTQCITCPGCKCEVNVYVAGGGRVCVSDRAFTEADRQKLARREVLRREIASLTRTASAIPPERERPVPEPEPRMLTRATFVGNLLASPPRGRAPAEFLALKRSRPASLETVDLSAIMGEISACSATKLYTDHVAKYGTLAMPTMSVAEARSLTQKYALAKQNYETLKSARDAAVARFASMTEPSAECPAELPNLSSSMRRAEQYARAYMALEGLRKTAAERDVEVRALMEKTGIIARAAAVVNKARTLYLEEAIASLAKHVNETLATLFDVNAFYSLTLDARENVVATLNLGGRMDIDPSSLSGGELDRFSVALSVAFAKYRISPFIFFDETISSLDPGRRIECVETVNALLPGMPVIFISHDPPEGLFETIVPIK
jgi:energy-coupling factor transporter ATP-binding protein EcfA2